MNAGTPIFALSIRQPWAWLIVQGHKDVENRTWPSTFRGAVWIHAGLTMTAAEYGACQDFIAQFTDLKLPPAEKLARGGIVGQAVVTDCVATSASPWFVGEYGFVMAERQPVAFRPCKGALGFFKPKFAIASPTLNLSAVPAVGNNAEAASSPIPGPVAPTGPGLIATQADFTAGLGIATPTWHDHQRGGGR